MKNVLSDQSIDETTCTTMFNAHAHGMFRMGVKIWKWPKKQVREDANQSTNKKYEMSHSST